MSACVASLVIWEFHPFLSPPPRCSLSNDRQLNPAFLPHFYRFLGYKRFHLLMHVPASLPPPWFGCPGAPSTVTVTGGHPWFAHPAAIRHHRAPGGFLGCVLESFVHVWFVPGSVPASPVQLVLLNPPETSNQSCSVFPLLLPPLSVLRSWEGSGVLGRRRAPPAHWHGGMGGSAAHRWRG